MKKRVLMLFQLSLLSMPEYAWMSLNKQDSEYAWGPKYAKFLNMVGFSICERHTFCIFQNMSWQSSEYILCSKYSWILNMTGFSICRSYTGFFLCHNMAEYDWINNDWVLNIYHTIHNARSLSKLMCTYCEMAYSEPGQKSKTVLWEL